MNTPYLMVCIEKPKLADSRTDPMWPRWHGFLEDGTALLATPNAAVERPVENVWLIGLDTGLQFATKLLALCEKSGLPPQLFLMPEKPVATK